MKQHKGLKAAQAAVLGVALLLGTSPVGVQAAGVDQIYSWPTIYSKTADDPEILTKGVTYQHIHYETQQGPLEVYETWTNLNDPNVAVKTVISGDKLENDSNETVSHMANRTGAVEGTNGDYFEQSASGMALNMNVQDGSLIHAPTSSVVMGIDANNHVTIGKYALTGSITAANGQTYGIAALNGHPTTYTNGIDVLTHDLGYWEMAKNATVVTLQQLSDPNQYKVITVDTGKNVVDVPYANSIKLVLEGNAIPFATANLHVGDTIGVTYGTNPDSGNLKYAIGGQVILLQNGQAVSDPNPPEKGFANENMPVTALGVTEDGTRMLQVVVDGRSSESFGMTYGEITNYMKYRGLYNAMIFDGGGSSEMAVRQPGDTTVSVANDPSDGSERHVANGVFVYSTSAPGQPTYVTVNDNKGLVVFKGTTTKLSGAYVRDENYNPLPNESVTYSVVPSTLGTISADGTFTAGLNAGTGQIVATTASGVTGQVPVQVFATVDSLKVSPSTADIGPGSTQALTVTGTFQGKTITIDPSYLTWSTSDAALGTVSPAGVFTAASGQVKGTEKITAKLGSTSSVATVGIGFVQKTLDPLTDAGKWTRSSRWGDVGTLSTATAPIQGDKNTSLSVNYSFPASSGMKQFVFYPKTTELVPGLDDFAAVNPIAVGAWVYGDNSGLKLLASFADPNNANSPDWHSTNSVTINWSGWKYVTFTIPAGHTFPLMMNYLDLYSDVDTTATLSGHIYLSDLQTVYAARTYAEKPLPTFADIQNHWAKSYIQQLALRGIVSGTDSTHFSPDSNLTRAQAVSLIVRALNLPADPQAASKFTDVKSNFWYDGSIGAGVKAGIINGTGNNQFAPDAPVDRNQAAVMIYNALKYAGKLPSGGTPIQFADADQIAPYAKTAIDTLSAAGLMTGDGAGHLTPTSITSRAQATVMIYNMMKQMGLLK